MERALFLQSFGLGDCIFAQTIAHGFIDAGYKVVWPVLPFFLDGLQSAYPQVEWVDVNSGYSKYLNIQDDRLIDGYHIVPIRWSRELTKTSYDNVMTAKYDMYGMDWKRWKEHAMPVRDSKKEKDLFYNVLGLTDDKEFRVVNRFFRSNNSGRADIQPDAMLHNVEMKSYSGYSLFDWCYTLERATEIHTVSTSVFYLLEILDLKSPADLYLRIPDEKDFKNVEKLFSKPYILHHQK